MKKDRRGDSTGLINRIDSGSLYLCSHMCVDDTCCAAQNPFGDWKTCSSHYRGCYQPASLSCQASPADEGCFLTIMTPSQGKPATNVRFLWEYKVPPSHPNSRQLWRALSLRAPYGVDKGFCCDSITTQCLPLLRIDSFLFLYVLISTALF